MFECECCKNKTDMIGHGTGWRVHESGYICPDCDKQIKADGMRLEKERHYYVLPNGIEAKDVSGWFTGNLAIAINYIWRAGKKPGASYQDDIQKAIDHLEFELERIKNV